MPDRQAAAARPVPVRPMAPARRFFHINFHDHQSCTASTSVAAVDAARGGERGIGRPGPRNNAIVRRLGISAYKETYHLKSVSAKLAVNSHAKAVMRVVSRLVV